MITEQQIEELEQQCWLEYVAKMAPPIDIIHWVEIGFKAGLQIGILEAIKLLQEQAK